MQFDLTPEEINRINDNVANGEAATIQAIKEGIASFERGEGRPAEKALKEIAEKHGIEKDKISDKSEG